MPVNIYIQNKDIDDLIEFYNLKLKKIKQNKIELDKEEKSIKATILQLKSKKAVYDNAVDLFIPKNENESVYSVKWTWAKKIHFAINEARKPLTTNEIVDALSIYEPDFEEGGSERRKAIASISSTLSVKAGLEMELDKEFVRIDEGTGRSKFNLRQEEFIKNEEPVPTITLEEEKIEAVDKLPF